MYDLHSLSGDMTHQQLDTTMPTDVGNRGCIASSNSLSSLYITGGFDDDTGIMDDLQVLNLQDLTWIVNAPSMLYARLAHGCTVIDDTLWVIGYVEAVEMIGITPSDDIGMELWTEMMVYCSYRYVHFVGSAMITVITTWKYS